MLTDFSSECMSLFIRVTRARVSSSISDSTQVSQRRIEVAGATSVPIVSPCNHDVHPFFHSIYNTSLCAYLFASHFFLCPPFIYTIILEFFYAICLTPPPPSVLCCILFTFYSSSFRLFTTYTIFFYSVLLSPPFHFPFLRNYEMDLAFIPKSFATLLYIIALELSR
jgi:hypothetical protein